MYVKMLKNYVKIDIKMLMFICYLNRCYVRYIFNYILFYDCYENVISI